MAYFTYPKARITNFAEYHHLYSKIIYKSDSHPRFPRICPRDILSHFSFFENVVHRIL